MPFTFHNSVFHLFKIEHTALASVAQMVGLCPVHWRLGKGGGGVAGLITSQGTRLGCSLHPGEGHGGESRLMFRSHMGVSLSPSSSPSL